MSEYVVITGLSGAGRSEAAAVLEDLGWFVIDNLPPPLIPRIVDLAEAPGSSIDRVALAAGGGVYHDELVEELGRLRGSVGGARILFLDAATDVLVRRYENTRRRHPLSDGSLTDAIERERRIFEDVKGEADVVVDTSELNVHELRDRIVDLFGSEQADVAMQVTVQSFGYKHGLPLDSDLVFDLRFLPNPHWVDELRPLTGRDEPVRAYVLRQEMTRDFLERLESLLELVLPAYVAEGKSYLTLSLGCTGGRHRSVCLAEEVGQVCRRLGFEPTVKHRDVER